MWLIQARTPTSWHHEGLFMHMHWLWWVVWIVLILLVVWGFVRLVGEERSRRDERIRREAADDVLRRRFSEGEIDEDEFLHRMHLLRESRSSRDGPSQG